uniref:E3 ubiquitin-protein ligase RBX1 n=1 Tax=Bos mutus grunniens TaxID=30521 RepID=A0A8B9WNX8_BOSMU
MAAAMDVDTPSGTNSGAGKKRFEVKKWNAVALWAWDIVVDNCAICRNHIMDLCACSVKNRNKRDQSVITATWKAQSKYFALESSLGLCWLFTALGVFEF